ncbi:hypothetical protein HDU85_000127 [Gaertneriomyces sp. JEL0708]|nr:hypothetical protein HDU85_000127 [Gaertneriomyces sp. JEL0708]
MTMTEITEMSMGFSNPSAVSLPSALIWLTGEVDGSASEAEVGDGREAVDSSGAFVGCTVGDSTGLGEGIDITGTVVGSGAIEDEL